MSELKNEILHDAHNSRYSIHPGSTKMYQDLKHNFLWPNMKKEIAEWVSRCDTCQRVNVTPPTRGQEFGPSHVTLACILLLFPQYSIQYNLTTPYISSHTS